MVASNSPTVAPSLLRNTTRARHNMTHNAPITAIATGTPNSAARCNGKLCA